MADAEPTTGKRAAHRAEVRQRIEDVLLDFMAKGETQRLNHDAVAEAAGVSRRTVYRYYPDRDALLKALWARTMRAAGPGVRIPQDAAEVLGRLDEAFTGFDRNATAIMVALSTPEGRAVRNAAKRERVGGWRQALEPELAAVPERQRDWALGVIQLLSTGFAWREMRDQWDMDGSEIAAASRWAIRVLLKDLAERKGRPLTED
jgi:AcrR family transcriptional regulator